MLPTGHSHQSQGSARACGRLEASNATTTAKLIAPLYGKRRKIVTQCNRNLLVGLQPASPNRQTTTTGPRGDSGHGRIAVQRSDRASRSLPVRKQVTAPSHPNKLHVSAWRGPACLQPQVQSFRGSMAYSENVGPIPAHGQLSSGGPKPPKLVRTWPRAVVRISRVNAPRHERYDEVSG